MSCLVCSRERTSFAAQPAVDVTVFLFGASYVSLTRGACDAVRSALGDLHME